MSKHEEKPVEEVVELRKPPVVYGGPYNQESTSLTIESTKDKPEYDQLISTWKTVSQGAVAFIEQLKAPKEEPVGPFVNNSVPAKEESDDILDNL